MERIDAKTEGIPDELWKDIEGYEGFYQVSNLGRVKSLPRTINRKTYIYTVKESIRIPCIVNGYFMISLCKNRKRETNYIHILLCKAFKPNPNNLPIVNHKDGNKLNISLDNLEWCTYQENTIHAVNNDLHNSKLTVKEVKEIRSLLATGHKGVYIAELYSISQGIISNIKTGKIWNH